MDRARNMNIENKRLPFRGKKSNGGGGPQRGKGEKILAAVARRRGGKGKSKEGTIVVTHYADRP